MRGRSKTLFKKSGRRYHSISSIDNSDHLLFLKKLSEEKRRKKLSENPQQSAYIDMLNQARESENEAIGIYLKVITCAPQEDIPHLTEIAQDENEHLGILSRLLMRYQQGGEITE